MSLSRPLLRSAARQVLENRGYQVRVDSAVGAAPGTRLTVIHEGTAQSVAVRTSLAREVGLVKSTEGRWTTVSEMDLVLVSVPARNGSDAEILCFKSEKLAGYFDQALRGRKGRRTNAKGPTFISLDDRPAKKSKSIGGGLANVAEWSEHLPAHIVRGLAEPNAPLGFVERVRREFADLVGVDVSKVIIEIRVVP